MKTARMFLVPLFFPFVVGAQTVTQPAPPWCALLCGKPAWATATVTAQLVAGSGMTLTGSPQNVALFDSNGLPNTAFDLLYPAISTSILASGVQLVITASGGGMIFKPQTMIYPFTLSVPAGYTTKIHYDALAETFTASAVPPPVTADGTKMPPAVSLLDSAGATWTVGALCGSDGAVGQVSVYRNGVRQFCSIDFATIKAGTVYVSDFKSGPGWSVWNGSAFVLSPAP